MEKTNGNDSNVVIPAKTRIQRSIKPLDARLRGHDWSDLASPPFFADRLLTSSPPLKH